MSRALNVARNLVRPGYAKVVVQKLRLRVRGDARQDPEAMAWAKQRSVPIPEWCAARDADLWQEARTYGASVRARARELGESLGTEIGGGARVELLYFLTRLLKPTTVVETGVLHGFSSTAFLEGFVANGVPGRLWSSDFPYVRERDPEELIGVLVPEELRSGWTLLLAGDRENLPRILAEVDSIDLVHYDSDKSYEGRTFGTQLLAEHLAPRGVFVMDDIQDNFFFRDWSATQDRAVHVLGGGSYCVGLVGLD